MRRIVEIFRKRKTRVRLRAVLLLVILGIELFAHAQNDVHVVAQGVSHKSELCREEGAQAKDTVPSPSIYCESEDDGGQTQFGDDEFSHHHAVMTDVGFSFPRANTYSDRISFRDCSSISNSIPTPCLPPELS